MTAYDFIRAIPHLPRGDDWEIHGMTVTNSQIRRWLKNGAILINGSRPQPDDEIEFPITELVFFPKGKRKTTYI